MLPGHHVPIRRNRWVGIERDISCSPQRGCGEQVVDHQFTVSFESEIDIGDRVASYGRAYPGGCSGRIDLDRGNRWSSRVKDHHRSFHTSNYPREHYLATGNVRQKVARCGSQRNLRVDVGDKVVVTNRMV